MPGDPTLIVAGAIYVVISIAFLPLAYRATAEGWQEEIGAMGAGGAACCALGASAAACAWPILALFWICTR